MIGSAYIEITNRCNLNCRDCYNASGLSKETAELSAETLDKLFNSLYIHNGINAFDISGGEPLMHTEWQEVLNVMERSWGFSFFIVTNGTIRDERFYNLLETDSRFMVQFSIDGVDEETHAKTRGKGNFIKTINNLSSLKPKVQPIIKMVVSRYNFNQIEDYFKLAKEYNCKPSFAFAERMGNACTNWNDMELNEYEKIQVINQIKEMGEKYGIPPKLPYATFHCPLLKEDEPLGVCIKPDGSIQPCQNFYDAQFSIGSIYNLDFRIIEENAARIRKKLIERKNMDFGCSKCINRDYCTKGCAAEAFMLHGKLEADDGACRFRKLQTSKISVLQAVKFRKEGKNA